MSDESAGPRCGAVQPRGRCGRLGGQLRVRNSKTIWRQTGYSGSTESWRPKHPQHWCAESSEPAVCQDGRLSGVAWDQALDNSGWQCDSHRPRQCRLGSAQTNTKFEAQVAKKKKIWWPSVDFIRMTKHLLSYSVDLKSPTKANKVKGQVNHC